MSEAPIPEISVDPERIAMGGHSTGATTTLNAAYGLKSNVAAIFPLSPPVVGFDMQKVINSDKLPPILLVVSQNDEPAVAEGIPLLISKLREAHVSHQFVWVSGFNHFYPTGAVSLGDDGTRMSVGERLFDFLDRELKKIGG